ITTTFEKSEGWHLRLVADQNVLDGRFSNNAWLQELPRTESNLSWDNAALLSPASAGVLGVRTGDMVDISHDGHSVRAPVWVTPNQADACVTLQLGYGRTRAGSVGNRVGFNAYPLRSAPWSVAGATVAKAPGRHEFATTQNHSQMEGRDLAREIPMS